MRRDTSSGTPLNTVWQNLTDATAVFRRGSLVLIGAGSGTGKSVFALTLAIKSGAKTIYFSADSGSGTQTARAASIVTGKPEAECKRQVEQGYYFEEELKDIRRIRWEFDAGPSLDTIQDSVDAYAYLHGEYPELIIVDNLIDVDTEDSGEGSYKTDQYTLQLLKELARETGACIPVLHHLTGEYDNGDKPPPLGALINKVSKIPEMVLTLYKKEDEYGQERMGVCIVKNRGGRMKASGGLEVELELDLSRMLIKDL